MANTLQSLFDSAVGYINNDKVKLDEDKAAALSNKLGKIASEIEMTAKQIEGPISETQSVWTGQAAEEFFKELSELITETKEIGAKVRQNRTQVDTAVSIIMAAEKTVRNDTDNLSSGNIFSNT